MNNVMIDLETLNNTSDSVIVSIGAVKFDLTTGELGEAFYQIVSVQSCIDAGLSIGGDTICWWMGQSEEARKVFSNRYDADLKEALTNFSNWSPDKMILWGNGSDFDNVILANAYRSVKLDPPWRFYNNRCYRTVKNMYPSVKMNREGTYHNALDDAVSQAKHLCEMFNQK